MNSVQLTETDGKLQPPGLEMPLASRLEMSLYKVFKSPKNLNSALSPYACHLQECVGAGRFWVG